ncbi:MAG TPA: hypothetical protein DCP91_08920 [Eggerthellaceae bacterium]|nr:hypothetical protein [Eggerthellaceae bacterium]
MKEYSSEELNDIKSLIAAVHAEDDPIVVFNAGEECLVAMRPAIFERILVEGAQVAAEDRRSLRL